MRHFLFSACTFFSFSSLNAENTFVSSYEQWVDPKNHFVDYFTVHGEDQARVIFIGSSAYSKEGHRLRYQKEWGMGFF